MATKAGAEVHQLPVAGRHHRERRRLAAIMFTDMVGYSALSQRNEALSQELLEEHRQLLRPLFEAHRGVEVKTIGDAFLVSFDSALDAGACAVAIQQALEARNASGPPERAILLRIGLHLGDVIERDGDVYGDGVNIAARIEPLAAPGSICFTEAVYHQLRNKLDIRVTRLGRRELKNIDLPVVVYRADLSGGPEAPALHSRTLVWLRRRGWLWVGLPLVLAAALGVFARASLQRPRPPPSGKLMLVVADFANETRNPELEGLSGLLITSLEQSSRVTVLTRQRMLDSLRRLGKPAVARIDESLAREVALELRADAIVVATLRRFDQLYTLDVRVIEPHAGDHFFSVKAEGEGQSRIPALIDEVSERTRVALNERTEEIRAASRSVEQVATANLEAYHHYFQGQQLMARLKYMEAQAEFRQAVALEPSFAMAHYALAYSLMWVHSPEAKAAVQQALPHVDRLSEKERLLVQGLASMVEGRRDEAIATYQRLIQAHPHEKDALFSIGDILFHQGKHAEAEPYFERALGVDPAFVAALDHARMISHQLGKADKALEYARRHALAASTEEGYLIWAAEHAGAGDVARSREVIQMGLQLFPEGVALRSQPGVLALFEGDLAAAEREFTALAGSGNPMLQLAGLQELAALRIFQGRYQDAARFHAQGDGVSLPEDKEAARSGFSRALWLYLGRQDEVAAKDLTRRLSEPTVAVSTEAFARLWQGELDQGAALLESLPPRAEIKNMLWLGRGFLSCARNQEDRYSHDLVMMTNDHPFGLLASYALGRCRQLAGRHAEAIEAFKRAQALVPQPWSVTPRALLYPLSLELMGLSYEQLGATAEAQASYRKLLALWADADPDLPVLRSVRRRLK